MDFLREPYAYLCLCSLQNERRAVSLRGICRERRELTGEWCLHLPAEPLTGLWGLGRGGHSPNGQHRFWHLQVVLHLPTLHNLPRDFSGVPKGRKRRPRSDGQGWPGMAMDGQVVLVFGSKFSSGHFCSGDWKTWD